MNPFEGKTCDEIRVIFNSSIMKLVKLGKENIPELRGDFDRYRSMLITVIQADPYILLNKVGCLIYGYKDIIDAKNESQLLEQDYLNVASDLINETKSEESIDIVGSIIDTIKSNWSNFSPLTKDQFYDNMNKIINSYEVYLTDYAVLDENY